MKRRSANLQNFALLLQGTAQLAELCDRAHIVCGRCHEQHCRICRLIISQPCHPPTHVIAFVCSAVMQTALAKLCTGSMSWPGCCVVDRLHK